MIVDCFTDSRDRTAAKLRQVFAANGGNLGAPGSVAYLFKPVGRMSYPQGTDAEALRKLALDTGAEDFVRLRRVHRGADRPAGSSMRCSARLCAAGFVPASVDVTERASDRGAARRRPRRIDAAASASAAGNWTTSDSVYSNAEIPDEFVAQL